MKKIVLVIFLVVGMLKAFAQSSNNNPNQNWSDNTTWVGGVVPNPAITGTVNIYGQVTQTGALSVSNNGVAQLFVFDELTVTGSVVNSRKISVEAGGILTINGDYLNSNSGATLDIYGTLIVKGNFTSNATVNIRSGGVLIIVGDLIVPNAGPIIVNQGQTVVVGEYNQQGGTVTTGNQLYIFDDTPSTGVGTVTGSLPTEASIPPPLWTILDGLGVSCAGANSISSAQTICNNSVPAALTGTTLGTVTYLWESSTTSATTGFSTASGTATSQNYTPGALTQTTWYRRRIIKTTPSCTNYSAAIQITVFNGSVWTGAANNQLDNAGNWCGGVPTSLIDALIPTGKSTYPSQRALNVKDLIVESGASVQLQNGQNMTIYGNLTNNGTFSFANTTGTSVISFQGTSQQTVTGGPYTFANMTVNSGSNQVVFSSNVTVNRTFIFTSGIVNMSGSTLTLGESINNPATNAGTLTYTAGRIANGTFTRYVRSGSYATNFQFPMGTVADNRPFSFTTTANITTGGTMSVTHTGATTTTSGLNIADGGTIQRRQNSFWTVTTSGMAGGTFNVFAGGTGFGIVGDLTNLRLMRTGTTIPLSTHVNATGSLTDFTARRNGVSFANLTTGAIYIGSIDPVVTPLPIKLISFNSYQQTDGIVLKWVTSKEENFDYFVLERAGTDLNFQPIATINGIGGLDITASYDHVDHAPLYGKNYYRLKSVDLDNTYEYSDVIYAEWNERSQKSEVVVYPNPISDHSFTLEINREITSNATMTLLNSMGKEIIQQPLLNSKEVVTLRSDLKPGAYFLKITGTDFNKTIKVFIQ